MDDAFIRRSRRLRLRAIIILNTSLPGLTPQVGFTRLAAHNSAQLGQARVAMQSIHLRKDFLRRKMDARVISAFTRVHSPSKTGVNALKDTLWRGEGGPSLKRVYARLPTRYGDGWVRGGRAPRNIPVTRGLDPRVHPLRKNFLRRRWIASQLGLAR